MSDTDQDYKIITTKEQKHEVKVRNYVTGADEEAIMEITTAAMKTTVKGEGADAKSETEVDAGMAGRLDRLKIERFVVAFDGEETGTTEKVYNLRLPDFHLVTKFLNELTKEVGGDQATKKKS